MVHYSVILPERDAVESVGQHLPQLCGTLDALLLPYEIVCIDDGSPPTAVAALQLLLTRYPRLRILRFDQPRGTSAALTAGLAASRGELLLVMDLSNSNSITLVPQLVARLSRCDLVVARRERSLLGDVSQRCRSLLRILVATRSLHASEDLMWGAQRRALAGISLSRGAFRLVEALVAQRGGRVSRLLLGDGLPPCGVAYHPNLFERLAARWYARGYEPHLASELHRDDREGGSDESFNPRVDSPLARPTPQSQFHPADKQPRDVA
jgi:glycosyltransferase involved in cell wall biosynthesis